MSTIVLHSWHASDTQALPHLLCENQQLRDTGIMGIYPEACPLEHRPPRSDTEADFLDIKQMFQRRAALMPTDPPGGTLVVTTQLCDKRREPCFSRLRAVQYSHASSAISAQAAENVCRAQVCRFVTYITDSGALVTEVAGLVAKLVKQHHRLETVWKQVWAFFRQHPLRLPMWPASLFDACLRGYDSLVEAEHMADVLQVLNV
jgi:hypothetical protein